MNKDQYIYDLLQRNLNWLWLIISWLVMGIALIYAEPISLTLGAILSFSAFDVYGFHNVATRFETRNKDNEPHFKEIVLSYRFMQVDKKVMFLFLFITASILFNFSAWVIVAAALMWWMGFCDLLYYVILKQKRMIKYKDHMDWLEWTLWGIVFKKIDKPIHGKHLLRYSIAGFLIGIAIIIWSEYV